MPECAFGCAQMVHLDIKQIPVYDSTAECSGSGDIDRSGSGDSNRSGDGDGDGGGDCKESSSGEGTTVVGEVNSGQ